MTIRVKKSDIDAFAKSKQSLEEFRKKAKVTLCRKRRWRGGPDGVWIGSGLLLSSRTEPNNKRASVSVSAKKGDAEPVAIYFKQTRGPRASDKRNASAAIIQRGRPPWPLAARDSFLQLIAECAVVTPLEPCLRCSPDPDQVFQASRSLHRRLAAFGASAIRCIRNDICAALISAGLNSSFSVFSCVDLPLAPGKTDLTLTAPSS
jgi:hypothetical protein